MKYFLFAGDDYYPATGIGNYKGAFDSVEDAQAHRAEHCESADWAQIAVWDGETMSAAYEWDCINQWQFIYREP